MMKISFYDSASYVKKTQIQKAVVPFNIMLKSAGAGCNLQCGYCYYPEDNETRTIPMPKTMLEPFIRMYINSQPLYNREINFVWQGGEPLLAGLDFYKRAVALQNKYTHHGIKITNSIQTNGTLLTPAWCHFFKKHDFIVGISLDGPEKIHDRYRHVKRGDKIVIPQLSKASGCCSSLGFSLIHSR